MIDGGLTGRCLCGAVTYTLVGPPATSTICHCSHCQRQSGSLFSMICAVPRDGFHSEGEMAVYHDRGDSGRAVDRHFCPRCGSPIISVLEAAPDLVFVKAGTLDDWRRFPPTRESHRSSTADWAPHFPNATGHPGPARR